MFRRQACPFLCLSAFLSHVALTLLLSFLRFFASLSAAEFMTLTAIFSEQNVGAESKLFFAGEDFEGPINKHGALNPAVNTQVFVPVVKLVFRGHLHPAPFCGAGRLVRGNPVVRI